jgi:hypothetical protein
MPTTRTVKTARPDTQAEMVHALCARTEQCQMVTSPTAIYLLVIRTGASTVQLALLLMHGAAAGA